MEKKTTHTQRANAKKCTQESQPPIMADKNSQKYKLSAISNHIIGVASTPNAAGSTFLAYTRIYRCLPLEQERSICKMLVQFEMEISF
jgi:hypothetical protein